MSTDVHSLCKENLLFNSEWFCPFFSNKIGSVQVIITYSETFSKPQNCRGLQYSTEYNTD